mmetsp:Transcript_12558/g.39312  ORF Transcript_12558/g.39312 Transcript_12558/m.39312 type:complete len:312 (+) Transcript_12558:735-1670(+)
MAMPVCVLVSMAMLVRVLVPMAMALLVCAGALPAVAVCSRLCGRLVHRRRLARRRPLPEVLPHALLALLQEDCHVPVVTGAVELPKPLVKAPQTAEELALEPRYAVSLGPDLKPRPPNVEADILCFGLRGHLHPELKGSLVLGPAVAKAAPRLGVSDGGRDLWQHLCGAHPPKGGPDKLGCRVQRAQHLFGGLEICGRRKVRLVHEHHVGLLDLLREELPHCFEAALVPGVLLIPLARLPAVQPVAAEQARIDDGHAALDLGHERRGHADLNADVPMLPDFFWLSDPAELDDDMVEGAGPHPVGELLDRGN